MWRTVYQMEQHLYCALGRELLNLTFQEKLEMFYVEISRFLNVGKSLENFKL